MMNKNPFTSNFVVGTFCLFLLLLNYVFLNSLFNTETNAGYGLIAIWLICMGINGILLLVYLVVIIINAKKERKLGRTSTLINLMVLILTFIFLIYGIPKLI